MSSGLEQRRLMLLQRCTRQREEIGKEVDSIRVQLAGVQRGIRIVQQLTTSPGLLVFGSVLALLVIKGRGRTLQLISSGLALWAGIRRLKQGRTQLAELLLQSDN